MENTWGAILELRTNIGHHNEQDRRRRGHTVADRDLGIGDLGGGGAVHLAHALPRRADTVHAGMHIAQSAAIGVERQLAARRGVAPGDEGAGLTARHEAEVFEALNRQMREGVVDHQMVDVLVRDAGLGEGRAAGDPEGARAQGVLWRAAPTRGVGSSPRT